MLCLIFLFYSGLSSDPDPLKKKKSDPCHCFEHHLGRSDSSILPSVSGCRMFGQLRCQESYKSVNVDRD